MDICRAANCLSITTEVDKIAPKATTCDNYLNLVFCVPLDARR